MAYFIGIKAKPNREDYLGGAVFLTALCRYGFL